MRYALALLLALEIMLCLPSRGAAAETSPGDPADASQSLPVIRVLLDENTPTYILTHPEVTTEVQFPYAIKAYGGRGFTARPSETPGDFFFGLVEGQKQFWISPLAEGVRRNMHVVLVNGKSYPLIFLPVDSQNMAFQKVIFADLASVAEQSVAMKESGAAQRIEISDTPPENSRMPVTPAIQMGLMDFAKTLANLPEETARILVQRANDEAKRDNPGRRLPRYALTIQFDAAEAKKGIAPIPFPTGPYRIRQCFVLRNNDIDSLCFVVVVENSSRDNLTFEPNGFMVRAGEHVYPSSLADWNPRLAPGDKQVAFFVVTGTMDGQRNNLRSDNQFVITAELLGQQSTKPVLSEEIK